MSRKPQRTIAGITGHAGWLIAERALRLGMSVFVGALIARTLGPIAFGQMTFAIQIASMLAPLAIWGLESMIVKWLIREPEMQGLLLAMSLSLRITLSVMLWLIAVSIAALFVEPNELSYLTIAMLIPLSQSGIIFHRYFMTEMRGKQIFLTAVAAMIAANALRILLIAIYPSIEAFLLINLVEYSLQGVLLFLVFRRIPERPTLQLASPKLAIARLREAAPIVPLALISALYMSVEFLLLAQLSTLDQLGLYGAAVRITGAWILMVGALTAAAYPVVVERSDPSETRPSPSVQLLFEVTTALSILVATATTFLADDLVLLLFGKDFEGAGVIITIHIWASLFAAWRKLSGSWFQADGTLWLAIMRTIAGLIVCCALCFVLIPSQGAVGAAWAGLAGQMTAGIMADLLRPATHKHFAAKVRSFLMIETIRLIIKRARRISRN